MATKASEYSQIGEATFNRSEKCSFDAFSAVYGAFVELLVEDSAFDSVRTEEEISKIGGNIGGRLFDEVLSKLGLACISFDFTQVCEAFTKVGLRVYLGVVTETLESDSASKFLFRITESEPCICRIAKFNKFVIGCLTGGLSQLGWQMSGNVLTYSSVTDDATVISLELISSSR